jgi:hypothetical protein
MEKMTIRLQFAPDNLRQCVAPVFWRTAIDDVAKAAKVCRICSLGS